jgi:hypothetical protein
MEKIT